MGDRSAAEALKGEAIAVARAALPDLDDDEGYYVTDLVGLSAEQSDGRSLGMVHDVFTLAGRLMARLDDGLVPLDGPRDHALILRRGWSPLICLRACSRRNDEALSRAGSIP